MEDQKLDCQTPRRGICQMFRKIELLNKRYFHYVYTPSRFCFQLRSDLVIRVYCVLAGCQHPTDCLFQGLQRQDQLLFFYFEDLDDNDFHDHFDLDLGFGADDEDGLAWTIYMGQTVCPTYQPICCWAALSTSITCALVIMSSSYYCHCYQYIVLIIFFILILLRYKVGSTISKIIPSLLQEQSLWAKPTCQCPCVIWRHVSAWRQSPRGKCKNLPKTIQKITKTAPKFWMTKFNDLLMNKRKNLTCFDASLIDNITTYSLFLRVKIAAISFSFQFSIFY